jgi:hypothetical protein
MLARCYTTNLRRQPLPTFFLASSPLVSELPWLKPMTLKCNIPEFTAYVLHLYNVQHKHHPMTCTRQLQLQGNSNPPPPGAFMLNKIRSILPSKGLLTHVTQLLRSNFNARVPCCCTWAVRKSSGSGPQSTSAISLYEKVMPLAISVSQTTITNAPKRVL